MTTWIRGTVLVLVLWATSQRAHAQLLEVLEPANGFVLDLGKVNRGTTSSPQRISLRNINLSRDAGLDDLFIYNEFVFQVVASGGDLGPGHTAYWDIVAVAPTEPSFAEEYGEFRLRYRPSGDDDLDLTIVLSCDVRNTPLDADPLDFGEIGPNTIATLPLPVVNTSATPLEITAITSSDPAFAVALRSGGLPLTLAPEGRLELDVRFAPTEPDTFTEASIVATFADGTSYVIAPAAGRSGAAVGFSARGIAESTPVGAPWRRYAWLANYTNQPLVITGIDITHPDVALLGIAVGDTVPAHTVVPLLTQVTPTAPGAISAEIMVNFDTAATVTARVEAFGRATPLAFTTQDAVPDDGQLDFGTLSASSAPVTRTITVTNQGATNQFIDCVNFYDGQGFTADGCSTVVAAGASMEVAVTFTPGSPRPVPLEDRRTGGIRFTPNSRDQYIVELTALIPSYQLALSADHLTFADTVRAPATPATRDVTLTNLGVTPMPVPAATVTGTGFHLDSAPPPGTIAPLAAVVYRVAFEPPEIGAFEGVLTLAFAGDAAPPQLVVLRGTGIADPDTGPDAGPGPGPDAGTGPGPDAGTGPGPDAGTGTGTGMGGDAGAGPGPDAGGGPHPGSGCSAGRGPGSSALALGVLGLLLRRRARAQPKVSAGRRPARPLSASSGTTVVPPLVCGWQPDPATGRPRLDREAWIAFDQLPRELRPFAWAP
jgi:hypothetical protein